MPFTIFAIGSSLIVLGFVFRIIQVTSGLTKIKKSESSHKLRNIGILGMEYLSLLSV